MQLSKPLLTAYFPNFFVHF